MAWADQNTKVNAPDGVRNHLDPKTNLETVHFLSLMHQMGAIQHIPIERIIVQLRTILREICLENSMHIALLCHSKVVSDQKDIYLSA